MSEHSISIRVWGDIACFTRPEMKVERVSYPLITPSAARGVLEAIFWEPEIYYLIDTVRIVKKGKWVSVLRNEITKVVNVRNVAKWMKEPETFDPIQAGGGARDGTQRNMLVLADVEYIISAQIHLTDLGRGSEAKSNKYANEIIRRSKQGKCFHRPSLGFREFAADFDWEPDPQSGLERRAAETREDGDWRNIWPREDLGLMLYDLFDHDERRHGFHWLTAAEIETRSLIQAHASESSSKPGRKRGKGQSPCHFQGKKVMPKAAFFHASVTNAAMDCHPARVRIVGRNGWEG